MGFYGHLMFTTNNLMLGFDSNVILTSYMSNKLWRVPMLDCVRLIFS